MKVITIQYLHNSHTWHITDHAEADAAYAALKRAMENYKEYGNDLEQTVTIKFGSGEVTVRTRAVVSVDCCDLDIAEGDIIAREVANARIKAKIKAATELQEAS